MSTIEFPPPVFPRRRLRDDDLESQCSSQTEQQHFRAAGKAESSATFQRTQQPPVTNDQTAAGLSSLRSSAMASSEVSVGVTKGTDVQEDDNEPIKPARRRNIRMSATSNKETEHLSRVKRINERLDPLTRPDKSAVLLCWGMEDCAFITPALIHDASDQQGQWEEVRRAWYANRKSWKRWIPYYGIISVEIVEIIIVGRPVSRVLEPGASPLYMGLYRRQDPSGKIPGLEGMVEEFECKARGLREFDPEELCFQTVGTGEWYHGPKWHYDVDENLCETANIMKAKREIARLRQRPILKMLFQHPEMATANADLEDNDLLVCHRDILSKSQQYHKPTLGELQFPGLLIQEGWLLAQPGWTLALLASTTLVVSVALGWLVYGDWATAWQAAGCFLTLVGLFCAGVHQATAGEENYL
ncbi:hypothetical protein PG988_013728 [Apiospora saccharicola]